MQRPERLLHCDTKSTDTQHCPQPLVAELVHARPKGVLISAELLQLSELVGLRGRVAARLMLLLLGIAAKEAEEGVVRKRTE